MICGSKICNKSNPLFKCPLCDKYYCSKKCSDRNWNVHRYECSLISAPLDDITIESFMNNIYESFFKAITTKTQTKNEVELIIETTKINLLENVSDFIKKQMELYSNVLRKSIDSDTFIETYETATNTTERNIVDSLTDIVKSNSRNVKELLNELKFEDIEEKSEMTIFEIRRIMNSLIEGDFIPFSFYDDTLLNFDISNIEKYIFENKNDFMVNVLNIFNFSKGNRFVFIEDTVPSISGTDVYETQVLIAKDKNYITNNGVILDENTLNEYLELFKQKYNVSEPELWQRFLKHVYEANSQVKFEFSLECLTTTTKDEFLQKWIFYVPDLDYESNKLTQSGEVKYYFHESNDPQDVKDKMYASFYKSLYNYVENNIEDIRETNGKSKYDYSPEWIVYHLFTNVEFQMLIKTIITKHNEQYPGTPLIDLNLYIKQIRDVVINSMDSEDVKLISLWQYVSGKDNYTNQQITHKPHIKSKSLEILFFSLCYTNYVTHYNRDRRSEFLNNIDYFLAYSLITDNFYDEIKEYSNDDSHLSLGKLKQACYVISDFNFKFDDTTTTYSDKLTRFSYFYSNYKQISSTYSMRNHSIFSFLKYNPQLTYKFKLSKAKFVNLILSNTMLDYLFKNMSTPSTNLSITFDSCYTTQIETYFGDFSICVNNNNKKKNEGDKSIANIKKINYIEFTNCNLNNPVPINYITSGGRSLGVQLNLSNNNITSIDTENYDSKCYSLYLYSKILNFDNNNIKTIPYMSFIQFMTKISVANNEINEISKELFSVRRLKSLNISGNNLRNNVLENLKNFPSMQFLDISKNPFDSMVTELPTSLQSLNISSLKVDKSFYVNSLSKMFDLKTFIASNTNVSPSLLFPNYAYINENTNRKYALKDLEHLDLSGNNIKDFIIKFVQNERKLKTKNSSSFFKIIKKLKTLILSDNNIDENNLILYDFHFRIKLIHLDVSKNKLKKYDLFDISNIEILNLSHNQLEGTYDFGITTDYLNNSKTALKYEDINISNNNFSQVKLNVSPVKYDQIFINLKRLDISNNKIKTLPRDLISLMVNLIELDASNNLISDFPNINTRNLVKLDLSNNMLTSTITKDILLIQDLFENIEELHLKGNRIQFNQKLNNFISKLRTMKLKYFSL